MLGSLEYLHDTLQNCRHTNMLSPWPSLALALSPPLPSFFIPCLPPPLTRPRLLPQVVPPQGWDLLFGEANKRLTAGRGAIQHVLVLLTVPIVYPKIPLSESMLSTVSCECTGCLRGCQEGGVADHNTGRRTREHVLHAFTAGQQSLGLLQACS